MNLFFRTEKFNYDNPNADVLLKVISLDFAHYDEKEVVKMICENLIYTILSKIVDDAYIDDNGGSLTLEA